MKVADEFHQIKCPFMQPGYFTSVTAILGDTITLIDAGTSSSPEKAIYPYLKRFNREVGEVSHIILTHGHEDHFGGVPAILKSSEAQVYVHELDKPRMLDLASKTSFNPSRVETVSHGDILKLSGRELEIFHTPGHSSGSICVIDRDLRLCVTGDSVQGLGEKRPLLFYSSIAYKNSMKRLSLVPINIFLMGHPFPPFMRSVISGSKIKSILVDSIRAVDELKEKVTNVLKASKRPLSIEELSRKLPAVRKPSIKPILEELFYKDIVIELGSGDDLLWLIK